MLFGALGYKKQTVNYYNKVIEKLDTKDSRSETEIKIRIFTRLRAARDNESLLSFPSRERD